MGVVTIGQAPRTDMVPEMARHWSQIDVVERGALDGMTADEIAAVPRRDGDEVLTSRLVDGTAAVFGRDLVLPLLQQRITELEASGVDAVLLVCTGEFPPFEHSKPLFTASPLLTGGARGLTQGTIGVICPLPEQQDDSVQKFAPADVATAVANPYGGSRDDFEAAAAALAGQGAELIVLDCMGYNEEHRGWARAGAGTIPVVVARSLVARLVAEAVEA
ncbi:AroM family protein [Propioniciclava coleopterorum]